MGVGDTIDRPRTNGSPTSETGRRLVRRRPLPGGRAVVGGFLVALAAVLLFAAYTSATARPRQLYVAAARSLVPGTRLTAADLTLVALDLPDAAVRRQVFTAEAPLIGASVVSPVTAGALVEASAVVGRGGPAGTREVSLAVDRSRAVAGTLKPGEFVDILGTFGNGAGSFTTVLVPHIAVISIANVADSLGGEARTQLLTFAAPTEVAAEAVANAGYAAQITIVRSVESQPDSSGGGDATVPAYRAPSGTS